LIHFIQEMEEAVFFDPTEQFQENRIPIEKRIDPLTGLTSKVLKSRFRFPQKKDLQPMVAQSLAGFCPFCRDTVLVGTPRFLPDVALEGRLSRGEAIVVPNLFPYEQYSAVTRLTEEHFVPLSEFSAKSLMDGFMVSMDYLHRIHHKDSSVNCASINWNYLPQAGGGLVHPHFQPVAFTAPTRYMQRIATCSADFFRSSGTFFWDEYIKAEEQNVKRFVGRVERVTFLTSFAPPNMTGEVLAVFQGHQSINDDSEGYFESFSEGLRRVLLGLWELNFTSLNMAVYLYFEPQAGFFTIGRIAPRIVIPPLDTSDVNYYEKLHEETFCVLPPEDLAEKLRPFFEPLNPRPLEP
jgi:UDPglucose--hexose-1-phosphate uridylyltransferase